MNKLLLIGVVAASSLAITSCSGDSENRSTTTTPINAYNLFVPASGDGDVYTGLALYKFVYAWRWQYIFFYNKHAYCFRYGFC